MSGLRWESALAQQVVGLSAEAISRGYGSHPHDPSDLLRCVAHCRRLKLSTDNLRKRMASASVQWQRLLADWDDLVAMLRAEVEAGGGTAPLTYRAMKRVIAGGTACEICGGSGNGAPCSKCRGTGRRSGGRCRAVGCHYGHAFCVECQGHGYVVVDA